MTQKASAENLGSELLQTIDTEEIADNSMRRTVEILLNLIEQQQVEIKELREENQKLRDELYLRNVTLNLKLIKLVLFG
ncbi:MAG: hypothetical protein V7K55_04300 [Nostoc sp.]|uniref:hypothetical protein n=1 Tax=Nostoc sp. TaxID=1180 RepID=UPI002FF8B6C6